MNLIYIPYHDWRKLENEGHRTRDAHFIKAFQNNEAIDKLIIINRPITFLELVLKKRTLSRRLNGNLIFQNQNKSLWQIDNKTFLIDSFENDNIRHLRIGRAWYFEAYGNSSLRDKKKN